MPRTRSASKTKDDEATGSKDALKNGSRRSTRAAAALTEEISSSISGTRKSERLKKGTSAEPPGRSERPKTVQASTSSSSRRSGKNLSTTNLRNGSNNKENSRKELTLKSKEVKREQLKSKSDSKKLSRKNGSTDRAMLKTPEAKAKGSVKNSNTSGDGLDEVRDENEDITSDVDVKGSKADLENSATESLNSEDGSNPSCSTLKDNCTKPMDVALNGSHSEFQKSVSIQNEDGTGLSCSAQKENCVDGIESPNECLLRVFEFKGSSLPHISGNDPNNNLDSGESMQVDAPMSKKPQDDPHVVNSMENDAGPSCSSQKGNCMGGLEPPDGCASRVFEIGDFSLPCGSGDEGNNNLDNGESMHVDASMSERHEGDLHVVTDYNSDRDLSSESGCEGIGLQNNRDSADLISVDVSENISSADVLSSPFRNTMEGTGSHYDFQKSVTENLRSEDCVGISCSAQKDNCMEGTESSDACVLQVFNVEAICLPCTSGDEACNNLDKGESIHMDANMRERHQEDLHMVTKKNLERHLASVIEHGKMACCGKSDNADLIHVDDIVPDPLNSFSLFNSGGNPDAGGDANADTIHTTSMMKDSLSLHTSSGCKPQPSRFVEYWVPVHVSNVQLELYSSILLSNLAALSSNSKLKKDLVGGVRELLVSTLKCCNHPYVVEPSLQAALTKDHTLDEIYDIGCKASGKLQLLDAILSESKDQGLRFLILYQLIGGIGRDNIGDILEDYLRYKFGADSYERVDGVGYRNSIKQAACKNFNTAKGRFIFLLEERACLPNIKLTSVDAVIIYNGDCNPLNGLRALQRIAIDSHLEQINVFRLYSACTVEENILALVKKQIHSGGNLPSINVATCHMLLMLGASCLFSKLDEFHQDDPDASAGIVSKHSFDKDVLQELLSLTKNLRDEVSIKFISKAEQDGGNYQKNVSLFGELESEPAIEELPHIFWGKLLDGRHPRWKYLSTPPQRNRKRVHYFDSKSINQDIQNDHSPRKSKKVKGNNVDTAVFKDGSDAARGSLMEKEKGMPNILVIGILASSPGNGSPVIHQEVGTERKGYSHHEQRCLLQILKPEISKLCEVLQLQESANRLAERFLEYVINNHRVTREPETILQAFQISVCWTAASWLGQEINHKESLALTRECLKLRCKEDEAELIFSKMQSLMKVFVCQSEELRSLYQTNASSLPKAHSPTMDANAKEAAVSNLENGSVKILQSPDPECSSEPHYIQSQTVELAQRDILKNIKRAHRNYRKQMQQLKEKHIGVIKELHQLWEEEKARLKNKHALEIRLTRSIHKHQPTIEADKLKHLDNNYARKYQELELDMTSRLKDLQSRQQTDKNKEQLKVARWFKEVNSWQQVQMLNRPPSLASGETAEKLHATEPVIISDGSMEIDFVSDDPVEEQRPDGASFGSSRTSDAAQNGDFVASETALFAAAKHARDHDGTDADCFPRSLINNGVSCDSPMEAVPSLSRLEEMPATQGTQAMCIAETLLDRSPQEVLARHLKAASGEAMDVADPHVRASNSVCAVPTAERPPTGSTSVLLAEGLGAPGDQAEAVLEMHDPVLEGEKSSLCNIDRTSNEALDTCPTLTESTCIPSFPLNITRHEDLLREFDTFQEWLSIPQYQNSAYYSSVVPYSVRDARSAHYELSSLPGQGSSPVVASLPSGMTSDPLENELERIQRQKDLATESHVQMMKQLESDRDKEIAQILLKYKTMRTEAEGSFLLKKRELELNENKVKVNKFLAHAFQAIHGPDIGATSLAQQAAPAVDAQMPLQVQSPAANLQNPTPSGQLAQHSSATLLSNPSRMSQTHPPLFCPNTSVAGRQQERMNDIHVRPPLLQHHLRQTMHLPSTGLSAPVPGRGGHVISSSLAASKCFSHALDWTSVDDLSLDD